MTTLTFKADSITVQPSGFKVFTMVIFNPDNATSDILKSINSAAVYTKIRLIDKFDNGQDDLHVSEHSAKIVNVIRTEGKSRTFIVTYAVI